MLWIFWGLAGWKLRLLVRGTDSKKLGIGTKWRYQKIVCFSFSHTSEEYKMLWWTSVSGSLRLEKLLCLYVLSYDFDDFLEEILPLCHVSDEY